MPSTKNDVLMIAYYFSENNGVGSLRSRSLFKHLVNHNINCKVISLGKSKLSFYKDSFFGILNNNYSKIYISCGPYQHAILFSLLSSLLRKKLIIDFRDPWSLNILTNYGSMEPNTKNAKYYIATMAEKIIYALCTNFIVCTEGMKHSYSKKFKDNSKIVIIENGYDFDSYPKKELKKNKRLSFVCIGKFAEYSTSKAEKILESIKLNSIKKEKDVFITFIGSNKSKNLPLVKKYFEASQFEFHEKKTYDEAINLARESGDIGLLLIRNENIEYGTKVFDYIGMGLPFYSVIEKNSFFYKKFKRFMYNFDTESSVFENTDVLEYRRSKQFEKFNGILY